MERRHILIEATDGIDVCFMGYTHSSVRQTLAGKRPAFVEEVVAEPIPALVERWWQAAWRILNTDIFELWRTYGPKGSRPS